MQDVSFKWAAGTLAALPFAFIPACDSSSEGESRGEKVVARSEFLDSEAVTLLQDDESLRTELFDADGELVVLASHSQGGEGTLQAGGSEQLPFSLPAEVPLQVLHDLLFGLWSDLNADKSTTTLVSESAISSAGCGTGWEGPRARWYEGFAPFPLGVNRWGWWAGYYFGPAVGENACEAACDACGGLPYNHIMDMPFEICECR